MKSISIVLFLTISISVNAQIQQSIFGQVSDGFSKPLAGATVELISVDTTLYQNSNTEGKFSFTAKPGRYQFIVSFTGFSKFDEELLVIAGKSSQWNIVLNENSVQLNDVEVKAGQTEAEIPGSYSISMEKTMRVPANFFDPVRMATSLPGVVATNDQSNSISVKGYSPNALLWRLQGLDIVNPNHLANAGTLSDKPVANGGGVSILSSQLLDKTQFYSGSLPVQYGNALSGAMDMSLRPGSKSKREHTLQASLIGIDLATEGPMGKRDADGNSKSSYLINYRYSTIGLLSLAGVNFGDEKINFQDLSFHLDFDGKRGRHLSVFGFGGLSSNIFDRKDTSEWKTEKDRYDIDFKGQVYGMGFMSTVFSGEKSNFKMGLAVSGQNQSRKSQSAQLTLSPELPNYIFRENYESDRALMSATMNYSLRVSPSFNLLAGMVATSLNHKLDVETETQLIFDDAFPNLDNRVKGILWQPYISTTWKMKVATITAGVRYVHFSYNGSSSLEPRVNFSTQIFGGQLSAAYGLTSQMQQSQTYLAFDNRNLGFTKAHQFSVSYNKTFDRGISIVANGYYHKLFDVPVSTGILPYSTLNQTDDFVSGNLFSNGLGKNRGVEVSIEKKFTNQLYFLAGGSWYGSGYSNGNSRYLTSRYNGKYTFTFSGGNEWSRRKNKTFGVHSRLLYLGGLRQQQIDLTNSKEYGTTMYTNENIFPIRMPDYFRLDLRVSWRKNKPGYTRTVSIDIQNLTNQQNTAYHYYDTYLKKVETKYQLGLIPVLVYRIDF